MQTKYLSIYRLLKGSNTSEKDFRWRPNFMFQLGRWPWSKNDISITGIGISWLWFWVRFSYR